MAMTKGFREHLPVIIVVCIIGFLTGAFALSRVHAGVSGMDLNMFNALIFVIPCAIMLVCSFVVAITANSIGRQMYLVMVVVCLATGIASMVVTSFWVQDASFAAVLQANSPEGTNVVPTLQLPIIMLRDIAAYIVIPTVGLIAGAWLGSRIHPVKSEGSKRKNKNRKRSL